MHLHPQRQQQLHCACWVPPVELKIQEGGGQTPWPRQPKSEPWGGRKRRSTCSSPSPPCLLPSAVEPVQSQVFFRGTPQALPLLLLLLLLPLPLQVLLLRPLLFLLMLPNV